MVGSSTNLCGYSYASSTRYDLVVIHTNEGPEGPTSAEGLASYLHGLTSSSSPGYHRTVDENSYVVTCYDDRRVNGAGGVNSRAFHICLTGYASQSGAQWDDPSSHAAVDIAAGEARGACQRLGVPMDKITNPSAQRGICGHVDVSRYYSSSQGHTDPGNGFPWERFLNVVRGAAPPKGPPPMEHGMAVDSVIDPSNPTRGYVLERWGGIHPFGGAPYPTGKLPYWEGSDVARRLIVTDWKRPCGYVLDLNGAMHPWGGAPSLSGTPYWKTGVILPIAEL